MAYVYQAVDTDEPWHDTDAEQMGNMHLYGTISGGALTPDAANMTVDLAAGVDLFNGASLTVAVAANAYTLVADGSNERWAALCVGSAGTAVLVSGDAAASSAVEPSKPEIGERVLHGMYKIQAAQTIAANCEYQLDKRNMTHTAASLSTLVTDILNTRALLALFDGQMSLGTTNLPCGLGLIMSIETNASITGVSFRNGAVTLASGTTADQHVMIKTPTDSRVAYGDRNPYFAAILTSSAANAALKAQFWGFIASDNMSEAVTTTINKAGFRSVTTAALFAVSGNATAEETTSLSASHTLGAAGVFEASSVDDGVSWQFKIAGTQVASHTTQVPVVTTGMGVVVGIENNTTTTLSITNCDLIVATQDRT